MLLMLIQPCSWPQISEGDCDMENEIASVGMVLVERLRLLSCETQVKTISRKHLEAFITKNVVSCLLRWIYVLVQFGFHYMTNSNLTYTKHRVTVMAAL